MRDKKTDHLEKQVERLKTENKSLRETALFLKGENLKLKRTLRDRDMLFNAMPAGVILIKQGKIIEINEVMLEQLGYRAEEVMNRDFLDFIHQDEWEYVKGLHNIWNSGKMAPGQYDAHLVTQDGKAILCDVKVKRIRYQSRTAFLLILTRLEKRNGMEQEKIRSRKREALITQAHGLNSRFCRYSDSILKKAKDFREVARSGNNDLMDAYNVLEEVSYETIRIARILELIAETEVDQKAMTQFDLNQRINEAVASTINTWKVRPESQGIKIDLKTYLRSSSLVEGDPEEIRNVIIHMIINAVEAMPNGGEIHITTEDDAGYANIYIQDSGIGISSGLGERIFDPFFSTKGNRAEGLGLSLSYAIVKRHKGDIEMSSREGEGTIFHLRLPLVRQKYRIKSRADKKRIKNAQILIIQDQDIAREILSHLLTSKGCKVDTANNGLEGLGKLKRKNFDLVIADTETLRVSGGTLIKKYSKTNPKMSIALIRDREDVNDWQDELVADLNIIKPIDVNMVLKQVSEVLMNRS